MEDDQTNPSIHPSMDPSTQGSGVLPASLSHVPSQWTLFFTEYKLTEQEGSVSLIGSGFPKLDGTNYRMWFMRMTDVLHQEGLWDLTIGDEEIVKRPDSTILVLPREYQTALDRYQARRRRIQKAVGTLRLGMTEAIAVSFYNEVWITPGKIWKDVQSNYKTVVGYDANHLQKELYEYNIEECGTVLKYINKIRELRDKLVISGNTPTYAQMIFHLFEGLPKTPEWKT